MTGKFLLGWLLTTLFSCSIISDDHLDKLPDNFRVRRIEIQYDDGSEWKYIHFNVSNTTNKSELDFGEGVDFHFLDKKLMKIMYTLNSSGYAEKITSVFADGSEITEDLKYNANNQVTELSNSFFKDNYKLYYKNNNLDSIAKTRMLPNNATQTGFFKRIDEETMISIFPLDKTKSYSMSLPATDCTTGSIPANSNDFNKSFIKTTKSNNDYSFSEEKMIVYQQVINNQIRRSYYSATSTTEKNNFDRSNWIGLSVDGCSVIDRYQIRNYLLIPQIVPDYALIYNITLEDELEWITSNPKDFPVWNNIYLNYKYEPSTK